MNDLKQGVQTIQQRLSIQYLICMKVVFSFCDIFISSLVDPQVNCINLFLKIYLIFGMAVLFNQYLSSQQQMQYYIINILKFQHHYYHGNSK